MNYNYNKYENYIRAGSSPNNLSPFPTPSSVGYSLKDEDLDPFTDLKGYTHRNRVRHDVLQLEIGFNALGEDDIAFILNTISPEWFYIELKDKKTKQRKTYKVYASDKDFNVFRVIKDSQGNFNEIFQEFSVTLTEQ